MKLKEEFNAEYAAGLAEAAGLLKQHVAGLVEKARADARQRGPLPFDDFIQLHENFLWPNVLLQAAQELQTGKPLREIFAKVSTYYRGADAAQPLGRCEDLTLSEAARHDGRLAAFEQLEKILDVGTRDFDVSAPRPGFRQLHYWHRRAPEADYTRDPETLTLAWQTRRGAAMADSVAQLRALLQPAAPKNTI